MRVLPLYAAILLATGIAYSQTDLSDKVLPLDENGKQGVVYFDHKQHESLIHPDPNYPYATRTGAACAGCHHTRNEVGIPQLVSCKVCHLEEGNTRNPKNANGDELFAEITFHKNCISCHRVSEKKGPILCGGCHKMVRRS